jgi:hypothetical protein
MNKIIMITILLYSTIASAEQFSMRKCMILPITDTAGNSFGYKVYEELERRIKDIGWCEYKSSSDVIEIFSKYREKLGEYLNDSNVLKTVSSRLKVGTLIRVSLEYDIDKVNLKLDIIGENGEDIYLSEKAVINEMDSNQVISTILNWLEIYEAQIPYDGRVIGVLGEQITFKLPKSKLASIGQEFKVRRLITKKKHPLLKKIVEWDNLIIGKGKIINVSRGQALGIIKVYTSNKKLQAGDWVRLETFNPQKAIESRDFSKFEKHKFGKLGELTLALSLSSHTASTNSISGNSKLGGYIYGISAEAQAWVTRNYFVLGKFSKKVGSLSKEAGSPDVDSSGQNTGVLKIGGGYKYLPMGFFNGPQVDLYGGWVSYSYQLDKSNNDGFGTNEFTGLFAGLGGSVPLQRGLRVYGRGEIIPFGDFEDTDNVYSAKKSISSMVFEIGAQYLWTPSVKLIGGLEVINNSGKFKGTNSELSYRDSSLKVGATFIF